MGGYRGYAFQQKRRQRSPRVALPRRGYGVRPGLNEPLKGAWATPEFAARNAEDHWTIFDWTTGETLGEARAFRG